MGISEIINVPQTFNKNFTNDFFIGAMGQEITEGDLSIHHLRLNEKYNQILLQDIIPIGERIRDMIFIKEMNKILVVLENTPALAIIENN